MNGHHRTVVDIDIGKSPFPSQDSPTYRIHIHNFESLRYSVESPKFTCFGHRWTAYINPEGISSEGLQTVAFILTRCDEEDDDSSDSDSDDSVDSSELEVRFSVSVRDLDGKILKKRRRSHNFTNWVDEKGWDKFIDRADIIGPSNNVLRDGTLTFELQMKSLRKKNAPCQPFVPVNPLSENIKALFLDEKTADVLFAVQKENGGEITNFYAHRLVLQACARDLAAFCDSSHDLTPISIPRVDPHVFKLLLFYVYGGTISTADWKQHSKELIDAADLYGVVNLKLEAEARFVQCTTVTIHDVVELLVYANSKQCAHLKEVLMDFIVRNKNDVLKQVASLRNIPESSTMFTDLLAAMARGDKANNGSDEELDTMRVGELRRKLHDSGLDVDGSREVLIARLQEKSKKANKKRKRASQDAVVEIE
mmetsp:Transcript_32197/g.58201  ORF Transcript_32197/g.58201 Transcript_32197/m.58201 type:complete len:423 (-) Transcript_32197:279-1547(-)